MACVYCEQSDGHDVVCPLTHILHDEGRRGAFALDQSVATSDWVDAMVEADIDGDDEGNRTRRTRSYMLLHRYVERVTTAHVTAELQATINQLEEALRAKVNGPYG